VLGPKTVDNNRMAPVPELGFDVELRRHVAYQLEDRRDVIVADTVATFPLSSGSRRLDANYCVRLGNLATRLLGTAILEGRLDSRGPEISELTGLVADREVTPDQLFSFVHIAMSTAIDELSLDPRVGANTEPWPQACQIIRRASFDVLGAWTTRMVSTPQDSAIEDPLTTLHTRPVLDAVLPKECCRAERFEHWLSMMLIDIDNLSAINKAHGYGVGDRILERMGILLRTYFRQHDWVARYDEDTIAVLLPETTPEDAMTLAERTRTMVEDRLTFRDYRTEQRAVVTVSVAVTSARALEGEPIDHEKFSAEAVAALERAKVGGRNRVEHVELLPRLISLEEATRVLKTNIEGIEKLVAAGDLDPVNAGRHVRLERQAVETLAAQSD
jgi:diguanylate cyclase (GGDEF)-like protein